LYNVRTLGLFGLDLLPLAQLMLGTPSKAPLA